MRSEDITLGKPHEFMWFEKRLTGIAIRKSGTTKQYITLRTKNMMFEVLANDVVKEAERVA